VQSLDRETGSFLLRGNRGQNLKACYIAPNQNNTLSLLKEFSMKTTLVLLAVTLASLTASAKSTKASLAERTLLCKAVQAQTEKLSTDFALDMKSCLKNNDMTSELLRDGARVVIGTLKFNSPNNSSESQCYIAYVGQATIPNIVGGLEAGINCQE
jgi:hypothetical protein